MRFEASSFELSSSLHIHVHHHHKGDHHHPSTLLVRLHHDDAPAHPYSVHDQGDMHRALLGLGEVVTRCNSKTLFISLRSASDNLHLRHDMERSRTPVRIASATNSYRGALVPLASPKLLERGVGSTIPVTRVKGYAFM